MKKLVGLGLILAFAASVHSQALGEDCKRISNSAKRLACFDKESGTATRKVDSEEAAIQDAVRRSMRDPQSALFGQLSLVVPDGACQTVNGRNSMGGYTGNQQAILKKLEGRWFTVGIHDISNTRCIEVVKELAKEEK